MAKKNFKKKQNMVSLIKKVTMQQSETKSMVYNWDTTVQDSARTPVETHLTSAVQGADENERDGNLIRVTSIYGKFYAEVADTTNVLRVILYRYKKAYEASPMSTGSLSITGLPDLDSFDILYDNYIALSTQGQAVKAWTISHRFKRPLRVKYTGPTAASCIENPIYIYVVGDSGAVSDPTLQGHLRVYYKDL